MTLASPKIETAPAYDRVARGLHWSMALLIVVTFILGLVVDAFPKSWEHGIVETHKVIGITILALVLLRIFWRQGHRPAPSNELSPLVERASGLGHFGLYVLMFAVPAIGLGYAIMRGQGLDFGLFAIPPFAPPVDRALSRPVREIHEWAAYALIGLAAVHALAALWHHLVRKDGVLRRMLP
ncbi:cytochrome b [Bosea sp. LjRoot9]|uniref:cytochrome b n=1 Tax=Bosea sp. LjRoot9 TaxID=3342341 RepID=UPI003ECCC1A6